jgi:hypothetical protein
VPDRKIQNAIEKFIGDYVMNIEAELKSEAMSRFYDRNEKEDIRAFFERKMNELKVHSERMEALKTKGFNIYNELLDFNLNLEDLTLNQLRKQLMNRTWRPTERRKIVVAILFFKEIREQLRSSVFSLKRIWTIGFTYTPCTWPDEILEIIHQESDRFFLVHERPCKFISDLLEKAKDEDIKRCGNKVKKLTRRYADRATSLLTLRQMMFEYDYEEGVEPGYVMHYSTDQRIEYLAS